jgi:hypothetical protein
MTTTLFNISQASNLQGPKWTTCWPLPPTDLVHVLGRVMTLLKVAVAQPRGASRFTRVKLIGFVGTLFSSSRQFEYCTPP